MKDWRVLILLFVVGPACASRQSPPATAETAAKQGEAVPTPTAAAQSYQKECQADLEGAKSAFTALQAHSGEKTVSSVLEPLNDLWIILDRGTNKSSLLRNVHPDPQVRAIADTCEQEFSKIITDIGLSRPLYESVKAVDVSKEDAATQRYVKNMLRDFRRAGVDKDDAAREKIRALNEELVKIGQEFNANIRADVRTITLNSVDGFKGLPPDYIESHKPDANGKITLTTDYPDYIPFMSYAVSDTRRLEYYKAFRSRGHPKNEAVLNRLLQKRYELAQLLGYKNWAEYATEDKMIKSAKAARDFIERITTAATKRARKDYDVLLARLKKEDPKATEVGDWQKAYIEELVKREQYNFDSQAVRQYFPYAHVKQGLFDVTSKLFGVSYRKVDLPVWHEDVEAYELLDGGQVIGRFYLDMHPRADKYNHAAAFPMVTGVTDRQVPEAALVCNFAGGKDPMELMEHDQVETFFHEFGHLLHHLLAGKHRWVRISGINVEWDFVEAPSQLLEEWTLDVKTLQTFAKSKSGEVIPADLVARMRRAADFGKGIQARHQMFYASVSLNYYDRDPQGIDTTAMLRELQGKYSMFAYLPGTYFQLSFGHLDGYSALYYTYMWSLVIAKDLFSVFEKSGVLNPNVAQRYRKYVLEPGGSKDAADMVRDFLQRPYNFKSFERWLNAG